MRILLLNAWSSYYMYTGYDLWKTMKKRLRTALILGLFAAAMSMAARAAKCDRACLDRTVDTYLAAMVAHDPSKVALAPDVKFVENTVPMKPGEGLWKTASEGPATFKIYVPDPVAQQVGFLGVMKEHGKDGDKPIQLGLRLKLKNGKIVEAEHLVARDLRENSLKNLQTPRPGLLAMVPPGERVPRQKMLTIAESYYTAIVDSNGDAAPPSPMIACGTKTECRLRATRLRKHRASGPWARWAVTIS